MKAVVIENHKVDVDSFAALLRGMNAEVHLAAVLQDAWRLLEHESAMLLVADGEIATQLAFLDFCRNVRHLPQGKSLQILAVIPNGMTGRIAEFLAAGVDEYLLQDATLDDRRARLELAVRRADAAAERGRLREAVRESDERYWSLLEASPDAIALLELDGRVKLCNRQSSRLLGLAAPAELAQRDYMEFVAEEDRARAGALLASVRAGHAVDACEASLVRSDDHRLPVELSFAPVLDAHGAVKALVVTAHDLSVRRRLEAQLHQSQKMEAIGQLAGGIAHDFNNLLTTISGYCQLLQMRIPQEDPNLANVMQIVKAAERAANLTGQLLAFGRRQMLQPKVLDLNQVVTGMQGLLRPVLPENIVIQWALAGKLGQVKADPNQMEQVVMNLAVNARDAMPSGGTLVFESANVELDETYAARHVGVKPGRYVLLAISDTGCGMQPDVLARIFEPFFTTKGRNKGTGLGLSTVYGIVKQSGGNVWAYSEPGRGTVFKVYLPRVDEPAPKVVETPTVRIELVRGTETVLLAEDEREVRMLTSEILSMNGYKVLEAANGLEALEVARQFPGEIHLLLSDVVMPGMGGPEDRKSVV